MSVRFASWLEKQVRNEGWSSLEEFVQQNGLDREEVAVALVYGPPSQELCYALAEALDFPPDVVLVKAGYVEDLDSKQKLSLLERLILYLFESLTAEDQEKILEKLEEWAIQRHRKQKRQGKG